MAVRAIYLGQASRGAHIAEQAVDRIDGSFVRRPPAAAPTAGDTQALDPANP